MPPARTRKRSLVALKIDDETAALLDGLEWNVRVSRTSGSDFPSTVVGFFGVFVSTFPASICLLLTFHFLDHRVQLVVPRGPELAILLDPRRLFLETPRPARAATPARCAPSRAPARGRLRG